MAIAAAAARVAAQMADQAKRWKRVRMAHLSRTQATVVTSSHSACMPGQSQAPAAARLRSVALALDSWAASAALQALHDSTIRASRAATSQRPGMHSCSASGPGDSRR
ncbi:hypothetical protein GY15_31165 [Delftia sp. 670]|nr:hypothetical protein GY15_31165 [Delftia sp. 670]